MAVVDSSSSSWTAGWAEVDAAALCPSLARRMKYDDDNKYYSKYKNYHW
jgi:hypothetical protein